MPRGVPCFAFRDGGGKLDRSDIPVAPHGSDRMRGTALRNHVARTTLALATLGGHTEFELNLVERHAGTHMPRDFAIRYSTAYANDHDERGFGWLVEETG